MEDFVSFEIAKKLKEKGFDIPFYFYYRTDDKSLRHANVTNPLIYCDKIDDEVVIAPTISQVLKWLRDEKKLYVGVTYSPKIEGSQDFFYATIQYIGDYKKTIYPYDSYVYWEGAILNGIEYTIDNLI